MKPLLRLLFLWTLVSSLQAQPPAPYTNVGPVEFQTLIAANKGTLLDVRTENEFKNQHLENAGQLNFYTFDFKQKLLLLPTDEPVYLYCNTGFRSEIAAKILAENGYNQIYNLEKGIMEWNLLSLPTLTEPDALKDTDNEMDGTRYRSLIQSDTLVCIDFYAPWCAPCRKMMPMIDSLKTEYYGQIKIEKANSDASKALVKTLGLSGVPYFMLYKKGQLLFNHSGIISRSELEEIFLKFSNYEN